MADSTEAAPVTAALDPAPNTPSASVELTVSAAGEDFQFLRDIVRSLPPLAVKDLLSNGVCPRCIFRLFGIQDRIYSCSSLSQSTLSSILEELTDPMRSMVDNDFSEKEESSIPSKESGVEIEICRICLGIMQFVYCDDKETLVRKDAAKDFASSIAQLVKQEGYQIDNFSLEVSVPSIIAENENVVWLYMKKKYGSETWFEERSRSVLISAKDVLKFSIADSLETLLDVKSGPGSFRIRLTYTHPIASNTVTCYSSMSNAGGKRQKTGMENSLHIIDEPMVARIKHSEFSTSKTDAATEGSLNGSQDHKSSECFKFPKDKVNEPCRLAFLCNRTSIYFGGRYLKYSRNVSQTRWIIDDERMGEASVEEILGGNILPMCRGDSYKFHAAGREDIDVRMLGSGRPFLVEILNARLVPSQVLAKQIEEKINMENKLVQVKNLKEVGSEGWTLMREGESEKQKQYAALVWISRPLEDKDLQSLSSFKDLPVLQRTPVRVLHRRSPLEREKIIHWMKVEKIAESSQYFVLHLGTQAGTYIKEFVHGDLGRTNPSIGSILGCRAEILQLDVTDVKMDCFLTEF